jgi:hypothetical protein
MRFFNIWLAGKLNPSGSTSWTGNSWVKWLCPLWQVQTKTFPSNWIYDFSPKCMKLYGTCPSIKSSCKIFQMSLTHWVKFEQIFYAQILHQCTLVFSLWTEPTNKQPNYLKQTSLASWFCICHTIYLLFIQGQRNHWTATSWMQVDLDNNIPG